MSETPPAVSLLRHELRTPLSSVHGYLETILTEELPPHTARRFVEIALAETRRISALLDDLAHDPVRPSASRASVAACVREAVACLDARAAAAGVTIEAVPAEEAVAAIPAHRLTQLLVDLIDNAIQHGARPGRVEIWSMCYGERVFIAVDDDGPGIAEHERARVFAAGRRAAPAGRSGSGLGLAFVAWAASAAGGSVSAEQSPLGGARLLVELRSAGHP